MSKLVSECNGKNQNKLILPKYFLCTTLDCLEYVKMLMNFSYNIGKLSP